MNNNARALIDDLVWGQALVTRIKPRSHSTSSTSLQSEKTNYEDEFVLSVTRDTCMLHPHQTAFVHAMLLVRCKRSSSLSVRDRFHPVTLPWNLIEVTVLAHFAAQDPNSVFLSNQLPLCTHVTLVGSTDCTEAAKSCSGNK